MAARKSWLGRTQTVPDTHPNHPSRVRTYSTQALFHHPHSLIPPLARTNTFSRAHVGHNLRVRTPCLVPTYSTLALTYTFPRADQMPLLRELIRALVFLHTTHHAHVHHPCVRKPRLGHMHTVAWAYANSTLHASKRPLAHTYTFPGGHFVVTHAHAYRLSHTLTPSLAHVHHPRAFLHGAWCSHIMFIARTSTIRAHVSHA